MSNQTTYGPYTPIRKAGNMYFISGQIGIDGDTKIAKTDAASQTTQALDNLMRALESVGLTVNDIVKTTLFVTRMDDFAAINKVYLEYFTEPRPARSTVGIAELPHIGPVPLLIEIEAVAYKQEASHE